MSDTAADQTLARCLLQAPASEAQVQFVVAVTPRLRALALHWLRRAARLRSHGDADDLVQEFLVAKVLPTDKFRGLLTPVADGRRPLRPRLERSFANFLLSILRRGHTLGTRRAEHDLVAPPPTDSWPDVMTRVADQLAAIGRAFPAAAAVPFAAVLRLSERILLAQIIARSFAPEDERTTGRNTTLCEMVESVASWTTADAAQRLPPRGVPLGRAWADLCQRTEDRPQRVDPPLLADVLGTNASRWTQWLCRGRRRLAERLGPAEARRLFPYWPPRVFDGATRQEDAP